MKSLFYLEKKKGIWGGGRVCPSAHEVGMSSNSRTFLISQVPVKNPPHWKPPPHLSPSKNTTNDGQNFSTFWLKTHFLSPTLNFFPKPFLLFQVTDRIASRGPWIWFPSNSRKFTHFIMNSTWIQQYYS